MSVIYPDIQTVIPAVTPLVIELVQKTIITEFGDSKEQRRAVWPKPKSMITIEYRARTLAEWNIFKDFYTLVSGPLVSFLFDGKGSVTGAFRFHEDPVQLTQDSWMYSWKTKIEEVF